MTIAPLPDSIPTTNRVMSPATASILVVDDEPDNFDVIEAFLFKENYHLNYASNGAKALGRLSDLQPDVILLDVMMPELDGVAVCRQIKANKNWQHIPIVMVTALNSKQDLARCLDAGADDFIGKPISGLELRSRVRSMLRIKRQHDALLATMELREDMSKTIVHDLRNPLGAISMSCELLCRTELDEKQRQKVDRIYAMSQRLLGLTDDILVMSKLESGKLCLNMDLADIGHITRVVARDFDPIARGKNIEITTQIPPAPRFVCVDEALFRRILDNLLSNAIKFSPKNGTIAVSIDYPDTGETAVIVRVADCGSGVKPELQHAIFKKYEIGEAIANVRQTGLGLAFCKTIVEAHGGYISIEDNHPTGAIFSVGLPSRNA